MTLPRDCDVWWFQKSTHAKIDKLMRLIIVEGYSIRKAALAVGLSKTTARRVYWMRRKDWKPGGEK